jgi:hypothetical protein
MKKIVVIVTCVAISILLTPFLMILCGILGALGSGVAYWRGICSDIALSWRGTKPPEVSQNVWERHLERLKEKNKNK